MYFNKLNLWNYILKKSILHIALEMYIKQIISNLQTCDYVCGDLYPNNKSVQKIDIYFDFIICNHVLEHIQDDIRAIAELYRVLKKGGYAVL